MPIITFFEFWFQYYAQIQYKILQMLFCWNFDCSAKWHSLKWLMHFFHMRINFFFFIHLLQSTAFQNERWREHGIRCTISLIHLPVVSIFQLFHIVCPSNVRSFSSHFTMALRWSGAQWHFINSTMWNKWRGERATCQCAVSPHNAANKLKIGLCLQRPSLWYGIEVSLLFVRNW